MDLTAMYDRLFDQLGYCPNCFSHGFECKVYRPKADRGEWIGEQYVTYKGEHFNGFCGGNKEVEPCGWNTKQGDPISKDEIKAMHDKPDVEMPEIPDDAPF